MKLLRTATRNRFVMRHQWLIYLTKEMAKEQDQSVAHIVEHLKTVLDELIEPESQVIPQNHQTQEEIQIISTDAAHDPAVHTLGPNGESAASEEISGSTSSTDTQTVYTQLPLRFKVLILQFLVNSQFNPASTFKYLNIHESAARSWRLKQCGVDGSGNIYYLLGDGRLYAVPKKIGKWREVDAETIANPNWILVFLHLTFRNA